MKPSMPRRAASSAPSTSSLTTSTGVVDHLVGADDVDLDRVGVACRLVEAALVRPDEEPRGPRRVAERLGDELDPIVDLVDAEVLAENVQHVDVRLEHEHAAVRPGRPSLVDRDEAEVGTAFERQQRRAGWPPRGV